MILIDLNFVVNMASLLPFAQYFVVITVLICSTHGHFMFGEPNPSLKPTDPVDKEVLEQFYHSTAGPAWLQNAGWLSGDPCQSLWYGIRCTESGNVIEITLSHNHLAGELPDAISKLKHLQILRLYDNFISGILPQSLFSIQTLKILDLDNNQISGNLPADISLPLLANLSIAHNSIQGYIPNNWNCPNLEYISLPYNTIQGPLSTGMSSLTKLKYLDISNNYFTGPLPSEFSQLMSLETLFLLRFMSDSNNDKAIIPESWRLLRNMKNFQASNLNGKLPEAIGEWHNLEILIINFGQLSGEIPHSFCNLQKIQRLTITNNMITGTIPDCFCNLPSATLTYIDLSYNNLMGKVPDCFYNLHNLTTFTLSNNNFSGALPASLGSCPKLTLIQLANNRFTGSIPTSYAKLSNMRSFEIESNKINTVEDGLEEFFNGMTYCSLYGNPWSCPLPSYLANTRCSASCSKCNTVDKHASCNACVGSSECGWCTEGPNCLEGTISGPSYQYNCEISNWIYGIEAKCNDN